jgi:hypothetical protein
MRSMFLSEAPTGLQTKCRGFCLYFYLFTGGRLFPFGITLTMWADGDDQVQTKPATSPTASSAAP